MGPLFEHAMGKPMHIDSTRVLGIFSQLDAKINKLEFARRFGSFDCSTCPSNSTNVSPLQSFIAF